MPSLNNEEHSKIIFNKAKEFYEKNKENFILFEEENEKFKEKLALLLSHFIPAEIRTYTAFIGGNFKPRDG